MSRLMLKSRTASPGGLTESPFQQCYRRRSLVLLLMVVGVKVRWLLIYIVVIGV